MSFGMLPAGGFPPPAAGDFPNFIQFQEDGVNLGGPDADTVNFIGNVSVTRGVGENANVVTVDVPTAGSGGGGGGGEIPPLVVDLAGGNDATFNRSIYTNWTGTTRVSSPDVTWNQADHALSFTATGVYEVSLWAEALPDQDDTGHWPDVGMSFYGSSADGQETQYTRTPGEATSASENQNMRWSDTFVVNVSDTSNEVNVGLYAKAYDFRTSTPVLFNARLIVRRLGAAY